MEHLIHKIRAIAFNYGTEEMRLVRNITDEMLAAHRDDTTVDRCKHGVVKADHCYSCESDKTTEASAEFPEAEAKKQREFLLDCDAELDTDYEMAQRWGFAKGWESCSQLEKDLANARWAKKQWADQAAIQKTRIVELETEIKRLQAKLKPC